MLKIVKRGPEAIKKQSQNLSLSPSLLLDPLFPLNWGYLNKAKSCIDKHLDRKGLFIIISFSKKVQEGFNYGDNRVDFLRKFRKMLNEFFMDDGIHLQIFTLH